ncbi:SGNH/GDSL hydrolase family protein [Waterburya agarophytonicola K14]|uniref:SGNH/GDSL hydrolase family protein n=1 Tax=Waterburya agarophytonicola KI4 TaxID=2874699 RepID=A0A964BTU5_9CYAN|nr:SGNH/GDSL hydrolase family protein [Waterburya agarophytonicola]MCC0179568.1 SGNH/GDSL hydrolase family protein [Waterburya agarophytonicola KI4]
MFLKNLLGINKKSAFKVAIVGGSNSVMRRGYAKYLDSYLGEALSLDTSLKYYSLGGVPNIYGTIQQERHNIAAESDIIFFEYCVNDRHAIEVEQYSLELAGQALEGFIRKVKKSNPNCLIVILIFGINLADYYDNHCYLSELYESISKQYNLPVINLTKLLSKDAGLDFVKSLYSEKDHAHYTRPEGVQIVSQAIVEELDRLGIIKSIKHQKKLDYIADRSPIYPDNFENLKFLDHFDEGDFFLDKPKISIYQNTVFRERNFTIHSGNSLNFLLEGSLIAIFIKSDLNDGFITIKFGDQKILTSSYSSWVNKIKPQNVINLIALPLRKFKPSSDFTPVSISICQEYPDEFEIGFNKTIPSKKEPDKWKLSIIGIAYTGEIKEP